MQPLLFLGHGSPMNAIEENQFVDEFRKLGKTLEKPRAILAISAHWYTDGTQVTAMEEPRTIHDFGGFPEELYALQYPAKGSPELAGELKELLAPFPVTLDMSWGLDHGTWTVLRHIYPNADVPVVQLSIDFRKSPEWHFEIGKKLQVLRDSGVLIVGSGNIVHNLGLVNFRNMSKIDYGFSWAKEAQEIINTHIQRGGMQSLWNYKELGESVRRAIPTPEHFLPLLYILGAKREGESIVLFNDNLVAGSLSMTSLKIGK